MSHGGKGMCKKKPNLQEMFASSAACNLKLKCTLHVYIIAEIIVACWLIKMMIFDT